MSTPDLAQLRRVAQAATQGPWTWSTMRPGALPEDFEKEGSLGGFEAPTGVVMHFGADYVYYPVEGQRPNPADTVIIRNFENVGQKIAEIKEVKQTVTPVDDWEDDPAPKGTFKKTVMAAAEVVKDENGQPAVMESPRRRLVFDDEEL